MHASNALSLSAIVLIASFGTFSAQAQRAPADAQRGVQQPLVPGATQTASPTRKHPGDAGLQPGGGAKLAGVPAGGGQPVAVGGVVGTSSQPGPSVGGAHPAATGYAGASQCAPGFQQSATGGMGPGSQGITFTCQLPQPMNCPDKSTMKKNGNPATGQGVRAVLVTTGGADTSSLNGAAASSSFRIKYVCDYYWNQG